MRWNTSPSALVGTLAAVPVTLLSREEDAHHPVHLHARYTATRAAPMTFGRRPLAIKPARIPVSSNGPARPSIAATSESILLTTTLVSSTKEDVAEETPEQNPVGDTAHDKFIICSGRSLTGESPRSNNAEDCTGSVVSVLPLPGLPLHSSAATETPRSQRGLQRTDSELELIINELREKIALRQRTIQSSLPVDEETASCSNHHARKYLKNPVEKMSLTPSPSNVQLRRQVSANQVMASRLVSEGTASMVIPAVLSSSASRGALSNNVHVSSNTYTQHPKHDASDDDLPASHSNESESFRIRSYSSGEASTVSHPQFTSSTSLGLNLPTTTSLPQRSLGADTPFQRKPRARTLLDLEFELDCESDNDDGSTSPVGPWAANLDSNSALSSCRSTSSLSFTESATILPGPGGHGSKDLSPRSRLLWLSDCCSDDAWGVPSVRVMEMLRPGSRQPSQSNRPVSALESRRKANKHSSRATIRKPRVSSAKPSTVARRANIETAVDETIKSLVPRARRPQSGSSSGPIRRGSSFRA